VILNPFAGRFVDDLRSLFEAGEELGECLMPELVEMLDGPAISYGKGAIVGVDGEMEHGGACVPPMLGKPMRAAIGGGKAVISSNVKVAAAGASLDVPLGHKDLKYTVQHQELLAATITCAGRTGCPSVERSIEVTRVHFIDSGHRRDRGRAASFDPKRSFAPEFCTG
jgi:Amino acid synthesis